MSLTRIRITTLRASGVSAAILPLLITLCTPACGASPADIEAARNSGYDTDFANVYSAALSVVRKQYPHLQENATTGVIKTSWHPVRLTNQQANQSDQPLTNRNRLNPNNPNNPNNLQNFNNQNLNNPMVQAQQARRQNRTLFFVRFRVSVVGGDPWRVSVSGEASEWADGNVPSPLYGANVPPWLAGRTNALRVRIHKKLAKHAVTLPSTAIVEKAPEPVEVEVDQSHLGDLPPAAIAAVVTATGAAKERDFEALENVMNPEFTWSLGADPSASQAVMMWQADSSILDEMTAVLEAGCALDKSGAEAVCPAVAVQPGYSGYRARFARTADDSWRMTSFVSGD